MHRPDPSMPALGSVTVAERRFALRDEDFLGAAEMAVGWLQVLLYLLLMEERYQTPIERGLLQYLTDATPEASPKASELPPPPKAARIV